MEPSSITVLGVLLSLGQVLSQAPIHGSGWDTTNNCPAIAYPRAHKACHDAQCSGSGKICLSCGYGPKFTNLAACCDRSQLPKPKAKGTYPCMRQPIANGTFCQWRCCTSELSVPCGDGCCKAGDHGQPHKCGRSPKNNHVCCAHGDWTPDEQLEGDCCIRGSGLDCRSPEPHSQCCLWAQGDTANQSNPDPHSPCQKRNCSLYSPCGHGEGYDCSFYGQRVCCLRTKDGEISEVDMCQRSASDCKSRWRKCPNGVGNDCEKDVACCLPPASAAGGSCLRDCSGWKPPAGRADDWRLIVFAVVVGIVVIVVIVVIVMFVMFVLRKRRRQSRCRPPALVIANSSYHGAWDSLPGAKIDGDEVHGLLTELGYRVYYAKDATLVQMKTYIEILVAAAGNLQEPENVPVPIYFAGHGLEVAGESFLVPVDATEFVPEQYLALKALLHLPRNAHLPNVVAPCGARPVRKAVYVCFLDACRAPVPEACMNSFSAVAVGVASRQSMRRQTDASTHLILHACGTADVAQQRPGGCGWFTQALLEKLGDRSLSLRCLADCVIKKVVNDTTAERQSRPSVRVQRPEFETNNERLSELFLWQSERGEQRSRSNSSIAPNVSAESLLEGQISRESQRVQA